MLRIRVARSSDVSRIYSFLLLNSDSFIPPLANRVKLSEYSNKLATKAANIFLTESGIDVGHAAVYSNTQGKSFLSSFCINHAYQGMNLGDILMAELFKDSLDQQIDQMELKVGLQNIRAHSFYLKHGFVDIKNDEENIFMLKNIY